MAYITKQQMIDRFGERELIQLTDRSIPPLQVINDVKLNAALMDASALADGYLEGRVTLPLTNPPTILVKSLCDIARYYLDETHHTEYVQSRYDEAIEMLEKISKGKLNLGLSSAGSKNTPSVTAEMTSGGRVFDRDRSKGFI